MPARDKIMFEILWYSGGPDHAPNRVIGRTRIARYDLTDAIKTAADLLTKPSARRRTSPRSLSSDQISTIMLAHGFYVRKANPEVS